MSRFRLIAALVVLIPLTAQSSVLDWDTAAWTDGSIAAQTITVDGVDITFTWSGDTGNFTGSTPASNGTITGGGTGDSLQWSTDFASTAQSITLTVSFSQDVTDVSFDIFNVDAATFFGFGTYQDEVTVTANSGADDPTTITTSANNSAVGTNTVEGDIGLITAGTGFTSGAANAGFDFGTTTVSDFSITFSSGASGFGGVSPQDIALGDITFTVPEAETYWAGGGLLGLAVLVSVWRKRRERVKLATMAEAN